MQTAKLKVEQMPTDSLVPYANNAKKHPQWHVEQIAKSIEQFGFSDPVGVWHDEDGQMQIVEGHGRVLAARHLGIESVPCIRLDHLDDEGRRAYTHIHNKLNANTGNDWAILQDEIASMPQFDWSAFGKSVAFFEGRDRSEGAEEWNDEYNGWLDKFKPKKTTDDCYTPDKVYDAVAEWVAEEYGLDRSKFVRPFYPGGDYENENYPDGCVVVDNPPFSILVQIISFYMERGIRFFIFAPTLTLFSGRDTGACYVAADCIITYENGACVNTSFVTNLDESMVRTAPELNRLVMEADAANRAELAKPVNLRYRYPSHVITAAMCSVWSNYGVDFRVPKGGACKIWALDAQKEVGKRIYGDGFLLSDACAKMAEQAKAQAEQAKAQAEQAKAQAEQAKAQAEQAKALEAAKALGDGVEVEPDGSVVWKLSEREMQIVNSLGA